MKLADVSSFFSRLRTQLAAIVAVSMLPAGALAIQQAVIAAETATEQRIESAVATARLRAVEERDLMLSVRDALRTGVQLVSGQQFDRNGCSRPLEQFALNHPWLDNAVVLDRSGAAVCGTAVDISVADLPEWRDEFLPAPRFVLGQARPSLIDGQEVAVAYLPLTNPTDAAFALGVSIDLSVIERLVAQTQGDNLFALLGDGGLALASIDDRAGWLPQDRTGLIGNWEAVLRDVGADGVERDYIVHQLMVDQVWSVSALAIPPFLSGDNLRTLAVIAAPLALWLIAVAVAAFAVDLLVVRHINQLRLTTLRIGAGNLSTRAAEPQNAPLEIKDLTAAVNRMAANIEEREQAQQSMLKQQHSLLLEVHHRVKNNLQMISSLMNIQSRRISRPSDRAVLQMIQDRIHGLALVHQNLYVTDRLDTVALPQLIRDLCGHMSMSLNPEQGQVDLQFELGNVVVNAETATPVALFLTEALANAYKHSVRPGTTTEVRVSLEQEDEEFTLKIVNTVPPGVLAVDGEHHGLGSRLMEGFARQLSGTLDTQHGEGKYAITLKAPIAREGQEFALRQSASNGAPSQETPVDA